MQIPQDPVKIKVPGTRVDAMAGSQNRIVISSETGLSCYLRPAGTPVWSHSTPEGICELKFVDDGQSVLPASWTVVSKPDDTRAHDALEVPTHAVKPR